VRFGSLVGAALVSAALIVSAGAGVRADAPPLEGSLAGGGRYIVRPVAGAPVAAVSLWYRAPSSGFPGSTPAPGIGRLAATAVAASQPIIGVPLGTYIGSLGGRMSISAYPESVAVSVLVPADRAALAIRAMTRSFFAPVLTDAGLGDARRAVAEEAAIRTLNPDAVIADQLYALLFTAGPAQAPPFPAPPAVASISADDVHAFAERAFRPANAVLVLAGDVSPDLVASGLTGREGAAPGPESPLPETVGTPAPLATRAADVGFGLAWAGPPIADEAAATACDFIADYAFSNGSPLERAASSAGTTLDGTFVTYHDPGVFLVTATGGDIGASRTAVNAALLALRTPLSPEAFDEARRAFVYRLLSHTQTADTIADNYGWYSVEGAPAYTPGDGGAQGRYLQAVAALTPAFVAATATRYLARPGAVVTLDLAPSPAPSPSPSPLKSPA
jgi:predicted Zn-dependent peptidase